MSTAVLAIRLVLAAVFFVAGIGKLRDLDGSRGAARDFGIPARAAGMVGLLLPLVELATAVALVPRPSAQWGAAVALVLLLAFTAGIANALRHGAAPDCHCFGQIHSAPAGRGTLARNAVLAVLAVFVVIQGPGPAVDAWVGARSAAELAAVGAGIFAVVMGAAWLQLWLQRKPLLRDLARAQTQALSATPGVPIGSIAPAFNLPSLGGGAVTLDSLLERDRPILLVFMTPSCPSCLELLPELGRWQSTLAERLTIAILSTGSAKQNDPIFEEHGLDDVLLQTGFNVSDAYRVRGTPSALVVTSKGTVGSNTVETVFAIEPLLRVALRDVDSLVEGSVA